MWFKGLTYTLHIKSDIHEAPEAPLRVHRMFKVLVAEERPQRPQCFHGNKVSFSCWGGDLGGRW